MKNKRKKVLLALFLIIISLGGFFAVYYIRTRPRSLEKFTHTPRSEFDEILNPLFKEPLPQISTEFGIAYTPIGSKAAHDFSKTHLSSLNASRIRFSVHWEYIEPNNDDWHWSSFDEKIKFVVENNLSLLLTIESNAADWACRNEKNDRSCVFDDNSEFEEFLTLLATRYKGKIDKIQFGNEMVSPAFYIGTPEQYSAVANITYEVFKAIDPEVKVVLGGFSGGTMRRYVACRHDVDFPLYYDGEMLEGSEHETFCAQQWVQDESDRVESILNYTKYDIIDLHFYDDYEYWDEIYDKMSELMGLTPIIVSEFGGPMTRGTWMKGDIRNLKLGPMHSQDRYDDGFHAQFLYNAMLKINSMGVHQAYYFKMVEYSTNSVSHVHSGLIDVYQMTEKPAYYVFQEIASKYPGI